MNTRLTAVDVICRFYKEDSYINIALDKALQSVASRNERSFITNIVYGVLRNSIGIDYRISCYINKPVKDVYIHCILRCAVYELFYLNKEDYAVVNEYVNITRKKGKPYLVKFVNGVLRNILRGKKDFSWPEFDNKLEEESFFSSMPLWIGKLFSDERGLSDALELLKLSNAESDTTIRIAREKSRDDILISLRKAGINCVPTSLSPFGIRLDKGLDWQKIKEAVGDDFVVQDEASQLVSLVLNPSCGDNILDMCAAPGGKTTHIAQLLNDTGHVYSSDVYDHKVELIKENYKKLSLNNVTVLKKNGLLWGRECHSFFDRILVDAPCSGLGVLHRRIDSRFHKKPEDIKELAGLQKKLLVSAYNALKPGGILLYSTCTLSKEENINNVFWFCSDFPDMKLAPFSHLLPGLNEYDKEQAEKGYLELMPWNYQTDGFFIARFRKDEHYGR